MAQSCLVIGHGFLGKPLCEFLHRNGIRVTSATLNGPDEATDYQQETLDVSDREQVLALGKTSFDAVIHCASSNRGGEEAYQSVFLEGLGNLREAFPDTPTLFTSSTSVYAHENGESVDETSETRPKTRTSQILVEAEELLLHENPYGIVVRLGGLYGPDRSIHLEKLLAGTATIDVGKKSRYLNQIHVTDAVSAIAHLLCASQAPLAERAFSHQLFNGVDSTPLTQRDCYEQATDILGLAMPPEAPAETKRKRALTSKRISNDRLQETGWNPRYPSFIDAVREDNELLASIRRKVSQSAES